jgi:DNA replication protein DnaC
MTKNEQTLSGEKLSELAGELLDKLTSGRPVMPTESDLVAARRVRDEEALRSDRERRRRAAAFAVLGDLPPKVKAAIHEDRLQHGKDWPVIDASLAWLRTKSRVLLIRGGVGVGKTMAAGAVVAEYCRTAIDECVRSGEVRRPFSWHRPNDFVSAMLHSYDPKAPTLGNELVVIDDIGRAQEKADFEEALCAFLDDNAQRLVMTTNLKKEDFRERYDARIIDRLLECGQAITIKGDSRRKPGGDF